MVEHTVPLVGHAFIALADRDTRMLLVGVPAGLIALLALVELGKALRPRRGVDEPASAAPSTSGAPDGGPVVPGQTRGEPVARPLVVPAQAQA